MVEIEFSVMVNTVGDEKHLRPVLDAFEKDKLITGIKNIRADRYANPDEDLNACLHKHLDPIARRLNNILGN